MLDTIIAAGLEAASNDDREWAVNRPSRSVSAVRNAAAVPSRWRAFAECVEQRESGGSPTAVNGSSGAAGLFQFMPAWRQSLPYIVAERLKQFGTPKPQARQVRVYLQQLGRVERYPALYQRIAFAEVIEDGAWQHWTLRGSRCQGLVP